MWPDGVNIEIYLGCPNQATMLGVTEFAWTSTFDPNKESNPEFRSFGILTRLVRAELPKLLPGDGRALTEDEVRALQRQVALHGSLRAGFDDAERDPAVGRSSEGR
jgi:hypothetical protein